jgi:hypothetical protein
MPLDDIGCSNSGVVQAEGWDYDEDVANNDIEAEVNKEVAAERQEEELAELEQEHMELEKVLKKEGRVDNQKDDDNDLKLDLGDDEEDEELPTVAAERRREQQAEKEGAKHMSKLRKRVKVSAFLHKADRSMRMNQCTTPASDGTEAIFHLMHPCELMLQSIPLAPRLDMIQAVRMC